MPAVMDPSGVGLQGNLSTFYGGTPTQAHIFIAWNKPGARLCDDRGLQRQNVDLVG
jgi:hypothetical protein